MAFLINFQVMLLLSVQGTLFEDHWLDLVRLKNTLWEHPKQLPASDWEVLIQSETVMDVFLYCKRVSSSFKIKPIKYVRLLEKIKMALQDEFCRHFHIFCL